MGWWTMWPRFGAGDFVDREYILFSTDQANLLRYIQLDYVNDEYTDLGSFYTGTTQSLITDGETVIRTAGSGIFAQYHWRGSCFTNTHTEDLGYSNPSDFMIRLQNMDNQFVVCGVYGFGRGFAVVNYEPDIDGTLAMSTAYARNTGAGAVWNGMWDLRTVAPNTPVLGDDLFLAGDTDGTNTTKLHTYEQDASNVLQLAFPELGDTAIVINTVPTDWGVDRDGGWAAKRSGSGFILYSIDMDTLDISTIGTCTSTTDPVFAVVPVPTTDGVKFLTSETTGSTHTLRTYSRSGTTLTLLDELTQPSSNTNSNVRFWVSPYSNRIWLQGVGSQASLHVTVDADTGDIAVPFTLGYGSGSSGYRGSFIGFLKNSLSISTNGYDGLKGKLFQCWEMDEAGTADRDPAFTDTNAEQVPLVNRGSMDNTTSDVGNAALFDGSSALEVDTVTTEMGTTGTFSQCIDVTLASKSADQTILCRARDDFVPSINPDQEDFRLYYASGTDRFVFYIRWGSTAYSVTASDTGAISTSTKYHIYFAFNKSDGEVKIRVNGGTLYTTSSGVNINRQADGSLQIGRRTSRAGEQQYLSNGSTLNQFFWFWDELTETQQDFMYNDGDSRAFSEL